LPTLSPLVPVGVAWVPCNSSLWRFAEHPNRRKTVNNTARIFAIAIALALPLSIGACAQTKTSDSTGEYIDDAAITTRVKTAIVEDSALKVMQIDVTTTRNVVKLSGTVDSPQMVARAGDVARRVNGVSSVDNYLLVK
jgi:hyperosmotically inducible protein